MSTWRQPSFSLTRIVTRRTTVFVCTVICIPHFWKINLCWSVRFELPLLKSGIIPSRNLEAQCQFFFSFHIFASVMHEQTKRRYDFHWLTYFPLLTATSLFNIVSFQLGPQSYERVITEVLRLIPTMTTARCPMLACVYLRIFSADASRDAFALVQSVCVVTQ